ncbi:MAG: hypothetical protein IJR65_01715 [Oscillospiraceae bacterium]|nr:hypothetical protein [Oscillospiraceae bacterium]
MKKFWIAVLALTLPLLLSLSVWANAPSNVIYTESVHYEIKKDYSDTEDGYHLELRPTDPESVDEEKLLETAENSSKIQESGEISGYEVLDIVMVRDSDGEVVDWSEPVRVAMTYDKLSRLVTVFVENEDRTWTEIDYIVGPDYVQMVLPETTTVAFSFAEMQPVPPEENEENQPSYDPSTLSPQTGDNSLLWTALAAAFAIGATLSLIQAKKAGE